MKKQGKLLEVEKGLYFSEAEEFKLFKMKLERSTITKKYMIFFQLIKEIGDTLIINFLRFF
ncbi:hypothetical protein JFT70_16545 [Bacillus sp. TH11]|nr:hypothetical protein [Bacillus sp. TH11]